MSHHIQTGQRAGDNAAVAEAMGDSVAAHHSLSDSQAPATQGKVCCVCGESVAGRKRYKDGIGHYWCEECARVDSQKKHPAACGDCQQMAPSNELLEYEGARLCKACHAKRVTQAKRAASRKAAVEQEVLQDQVRHKRILVAVGVLVALAAAYGLFCLIV